MIPCIYPNCGDAATRAYAFRRSPGNDPGKMEQHADVHFTCEQHADAYEQNGYWKLLEGPPEAYFADLALRKAGDGPDAQDEWTPV